MLRTNTLRAALLLPAALAASYLTSVGTAKADPLLDAQVQVYSNDESASGTGKQVTTATAQANDLVYAVYTVLFNNPQFDNTRVAQIAQDALTTVSGKTRSDKDKIAGRIVAAAIYGSGATNDPARIRAILDKVGTANTGGKALTATGRANAIASALRVAQQSVVLLPVDNTNTTLNSGAAIAASANSLVVGAAVKFHQGVLKALGNGVGVNNLAPYINGVLDGIGGDKSATAITLASAVGSQPAVAGAVIAGAAADLTNFIPGTADAAVKTLVATAAGNSKLKKSVNGVVAGGFFYLAPTTSRGDAAAALITGNSKLKSLAGQIASGALSGRQDTTTESTSSILGKLITAGAVSVGKYATFAGQAALGNAPVADDIMTDIFARIPAAGALDAKVAQTVASAIIKSIVANSPSDIADVAKAAANVARNGVPVFNDSSRSNLAAALAKGAAKNYAAAGAAVAGVLSTTADPKAAAAGMAVVSIKANSKAAIAISQAVSSVVSSNGGNVQTFATSVAGQVVPANAGAVAAGAALTDPANTGPIVAGVINGNSSAVKKQTLKIASTVASAVDIERVGDVAKAVGPLLGQAGLPKLSSISSLATSLAKAINSKPLSSPNDPLRPDAGWHNRVDELGELAAVLVNAALTTPAGQDAKVLGSIGSAIYKAVSKKLLANAGNNLADLKDVAQDVAGAIFQTISVSSLTPEARAALLSPSGPLSLALQKAAGNNYKALVTAALTEVNTAATNSPGRIVPGSEPIGNGTPSTTGKYEIGNIVDPETPAKNV